MRVYKRLLWFHRARETSTRAGRQTHLNFALSGVRQVDVIELVSRQAVHSEFLARKTEEMVEASVLFHQHNNVLDDAVREL